MQTIARSGHYLMLFVVLLLMASCSMEQVLKREPSVAPKQDAQDGSKHSACVFCHRSGDPSASGTMQPFADGVDPSSFCLDCHHYETDHHPINIVPGKEYAKSSMQSFPLFDGQIRCLTCHQAHADPGQKKLDAPFKLLRGGPYADVREQCFKCHYQERYAEIDPHVMLTANNAVRNIKGQPVCLVCHEGKPDPGGDPADVRFRAGVAFLCWRCHASMMGTFMGKHFDVKPKQATMESLKRTEVFQTIELPLSRDNRLTCSTCHNPHQEGVILSSAAAAGADARRKLRMPKSELCSACHKI
jgi:hypothetical protein